VQQETLFTAVGRALSVTSHTDENLVAITGMLLRTKFQMAGVVMYSIINFHVRLNIIDELFSISPHYGSLKPRWNKINEKLRAMQDTRDRLAHHTLYSGVTNDNVALNPGRLDTRRKSQKYKPLDFPQITSFILDLSNVIQESADLINAMNDLDTLREKSSE
jgi:hypothetical protein